MSFDARAALWLVIGACSPTSGDPPPAPTAVAEVVVAAAPAPPRATCAERLRAAYQIDVGPEPRICEPLETALAPLSPAHREMVKGLVIVRDARGPCGDRCPDQATALLSDGALAFYRNVKRELHVLDAAFDGPRWRSGHPDADALRVLLEALDLPNWPALVARVSAVVATKAGAAAALPADLAPGDPRLFDTIVRMGAPTLLGGEVPLADLLRHELGHAILDASEPSPGLIAMWATLTRWTDHKGRRADGYATGVWTSERPAVAVRLVLGLPRGPAYYTPGAPDLLPTRYAAFDPMEDFAESLRLVHADPAALGRASPGKLLVLAADTTIDLGRPDLRPFLVPGVAALLEPHVEPRLTSQTLRAHAAVLATEVEALGALADPRPIAIPADAHPEVNAALTAARFPVAVGPLVLRPSDEAIAAWIADLEHYLRQRDELDELLRTP